MSIPKTIKGLRDEAERARTMAARVGHSLSQRRLKEYAAECDEAADRLQARPPSI